MTGQQYLSELFSTLLKIQPSKKNLELYQELQSSLMDAEVIASFFQLKKSGRMDGLELELMFFNENFIYDIVFTRTTVDYITVATQKVNMAYIEASYEGNESQSDLVISNSDSLQFTISYGGDSRTLVYTTDIKRFSEINQLKKQLLKLIIK